MKKFLITGIVAAVLMGQAAEAQPWRMPKQPAKLFTLKVQNRSLVVDANNGARITSLKYDSTEVLSQIDVPNMYGSTFWTSPQKEWNWPPVREHDIMPYEVSEQGGALTMTSQLSAKFPLQIIKKFAVDEADTCFVITYSIVNKSDEERRVAPWEITRVLAHGAVFFDAPLESITPKGLMPFGVKHGCAWYDIDHVEGKNRKINADGSGWLGFINPDGLVIEKQFQDLKEGQPAPDEAEIQVYVHQGDAYVELESQGAYTTLKPGEKLDWTVRWYLRRLPAGWSDDSSWKSIIRARGN